MIINKKKLIFILLIFIICVFSMNTVQAIEPNDYKPYSLTVAYGVDSLQDIGNKIIGSVRTIGTASSVIALIVIGIKYILGSVEERAEYKQTLKPYVIGAIFVFGISNILAILQDIILEVL